MEALLWSYKIVVADSPVMLKDASYEQLENELAKYLNNLMVTDFNKLVTILYRIDIAQEKAVLELTKNAEKESAGDTLARLIIERQLEKVITRWKYRKQ